MNTEILNKVVENRQLFVPSIFTEKQVSIIHRYLHQEKLNNTEKTYFYSAIKRKIEALTALREEFYIIGEQMIPGRVEKAKKILQEINYEKAFISGSFLFNKKYNDVDIFILGKKRKAYHQGKKHFTFITERDLAKPLFYSMYLYSVRNFNVNILPIIKRPSTEDLFLEYQVAIKEILEKEDEKTSRNVIFDYYLFVKNKILNSYEVYHKFLEIKAMAEAQKINSLNSMVKELTLKLYSKKYIYNELCLFLKTLQKLKESYKRHDNILIYMDLFSEVKNECRRDQT